MNKEVEPSAGPPRDFEDDNDREDVQSFDEERDENGMLMEVVSESDFEREMTQGDVQIV